MLIISTDGGARGNPGSAAIGVVIRQVESDAKRHPGAITGNDRISSEKHEERGDSTASLQNDKRFFKTIKKTIGHATNNEAEYLAVIEGFEEAVRLGEREVELRLDSQLVGMQLMRKWKIKEPRMQALFMKAWNLKSHFVQCRITIVPREKNTEADTLVNEALDEQERETGAPHPP